MNEPQNKAINNYLENDMNEEIEIVIDAIQNAGTKVSGIYDNTKSEQWHRENTFDTALSQHEYIANFEIGDIKFNSESFRPQREIKFNFQYFDDGSGLKHTEIESRRLKECFANQFFDALYKGLYSKR